MAALTEVENFLPEDDVDFFARKGLQYQLLETPLNDGKFQRGIVLPEFTFEGSLYANTDAGFVQVKQCELLILIPEGYATTKLDSFYTIPRMRRADNTYPNCANNEGAFFEKKWQFWSRHLNDPGDWRPGIDGMETYLAIIRNELRKA